ncbi:deaminase [Mesobacillus boroniphilus]|uniref:deaminase n=1 Tax=Mesobacillus boroniphilus TaxID=308892 RepID=UPI00210F30C6|nr:deaminase [Mesobacillus boroniphilus]
MHPDPSRRRECRPPCRQRLLKGATAFVTHEPCEKCSKTLAQSGITRIVYRSAYPNKYNELFLRDVEVVHLSK